MSISRQVFRNDAHFDNSFVVNLAVLVDRRGVDFENLQTRLFVGQRNLDFPVETTRSQERRIERVGPIGGHDQLGLSQRVESVHLVQQLHENLARRNLASNKRTSISVR